MFVQGNGANVLRYALEAMGQPLHERVTPDGYPDIATYWVSSDSLLQRWAFAGTLAVTGTSGPGLDLKSEAIGLAISLELPMVIVDVQRAGPSTGMPTKTEQTDLMLAMYGRHGESPLPVVAAQSPSRCFDAAFEACRLALKYRTPVILLTDGLLANGAEPWLLPSVADLPDISVSFQSEPNHTNSDACAYDTPLTQTILSHRSTAAFGEI